MIRKNNRQKNNPGCKPAKEIFFSSQVLPGPGHTLFACFLLLSFHVRRFFPASIRWPVFSLIVAYKALKRVFCFAPLKWKFKQKLKLKLKAIQRIIHKPLRKPLPGLTCRRKRAQLHKMCAREHLNLLLQVTHIEIFAYLQTCARHGFQSIYTFLTFAIGE